MAEVNRAVLRVLARDDLLTLAAEADRAVWIVRQRETLPRRTAQDGTLFDLALEHQIELAETHRNASVRAQAWDYAGVLIRFCDLTDIELITRHAVRFSSEELHALAVAEIRSLDPVASARRMDQDLMNGALLRYHRARDLRLAKRYAAALDLVRRPAEELFGKGAEPLMAHYLYETGADLIAVGEAQNVDAVLSERDEFWKTTRASGFSTRHRVDFIRALALWATKAAGDGDERVRGLLETAIRRLSSPPMLSSDDEPEDPAETQGARELSVLVTAAECVAESDPAKAVERGSAALAIADSVRTRWKVVARSRAPLAVVFQRLYGDLALLAQRLPGQAAAELGFRVALSAKQTGFATRIRDGVTFDGNERIDRLIQEIVEIEADSTETYANNSEKRRQTLEVKRFDLAEAVSPMLADTVFPSPKNLDDVVRAIGPRYALDFIELPNTLDIAHRLFRTLIEPGGRMWFEGVDVDSDLQGSLERSFKADGSTREFEMGRVFDPKERPLVSDDLDWRSLAKSVLPKRLLDGVLAAPDTTIKLLISAHSWLARVPWAALKIDDGTRLVHRAVITQTPVLSCLSATLPPPITGKALIRLVGPDEKNGVTVKPERLAWDLGPGSEGVRLSESRVPGEEKPTGYPNRLDEALAHRGSWQFLHIAAHGSGKGLHQSLDIPDEPLSAARALGLKWPTSVLMASCHVGLLINDTRAEPLNFVTALLTGGAQCVVAGIDSVDDEGTGLAASRMVRDIRKESVSLDVALRNAQLEAIKDGIPEAGWALLSAYSR